jgi:UDP-glucose 4-epimerase
MKKTILVTGGAGFIGTHLCRKLVAKGCAVRVIDLKAAETPVAGVDYLRGDVRERDLASRAMDGADVVYHLAATVSVPICQKDPADSYSNNFSATLGLLELIREKRAKGSPLRFAFASTAALYGSKGDDGRALREEDVAEEFMSFYAAQKHASEEAIRLYRRAYGLPASIFRFFNVFGPGQDPTSPYSGVITVFARFAREGKPLPLNGGGIQTRDFISVHDIVAGLTSVLDLPDERWDASPTNLGTGEVTTVRKLAELIRDVTSARSEIVSAPAREGDVLHSRADISRARERLGFAPGYDLRTGLAEFLSTK